MPVSEEANSLEVGVKAANWLPFDWPGKLPAKLALAVSGLLLFGKLDAKLDKAKLDAARLLFAVDKLFADADQTGRALPLLFSQSIGNSDRPAAVFSSRSRFALDAALLVPLFWTVLLLLLGEVRRSLLQNWYRLERF